jgi:hypothetical protein
MEMAILPTAKARETGSIPVFYEALPRGTIPPYITESSYLRSRQLNRQTHHKTHENISFRILVPDQLGYRGPGYCPKRQPSRAPDQIFGGVRVT